MTSRVRRLWIAATEPELACAPHAPGTPQNGPWPWSHHGTEAFLATGAGPVAAAAGLSWFLASHAVHEIVGIGIAGSLLGAAFPLGTVCRLVSERFDALGAESGQGVPVALDFPGLEPGPWPLASFPDLAHLPAASGLTVWQATGTARTALRRRAQDADLESMEGAAWARIADRFGIPFAQVRSVSNVAGFRDSSSWNIPLALRSLQAALLPERSP